MIRQLCTEDVVRFSAAHQLGLRETVTRLVDEPVSFARYGDGEWGSMTHPGYDLYFQRSSPELMAELRSVWQSEAVDPGVLMVGFPYPFTSAHWSTVWTSCWPEVRLITRADVWYGCTHVTRPVYFQRLRDGGVDLWRQVWATKSVCVVTGKGTRFELLPDLFDSAATVVRESAPPRDAYARVDGLERRLLALPVDLFLLSLGPTATVLAGRLSRAGRRAIDIGHLANSYKTVFRGEGMPEHQPL